MVRWERVSPPILLALTVLIGVIQLLVFPVVDTTITVQAIMESVFLIVVVAGLFLIPSARELTVLSTDEADTVYPPMVLGLGLFAVRAVTDVLDEFLAYLLHRGYGTEDERETVFEVGYPTRDEGTGLGLSIVDGIAGAHGWSVTVTESTEGGARFEVHTDP